jgi:hypothetical protein
MGFFGLFKKKDDFDSILKDPLSDPFAKMPDMMQAQNPMQDPFQQSSQQSQEASPFDMQGMPKSESGMDEYSQSMNPNNYNTLANPLPQMQPGGGFESAYPQRKNKGPEVFEEMTHQAPVPRTGDTGFDKKDFEILNLKLDTIKSQLENLSQRLVNIEKKSYEDETPRQRRYNW